MPGKARSCTACRQAKVACDARNRPHNTPCTRCSNNRFECRFDKNFKRILTRKLTANLTQELHQVRLSQHASVRREPSPEEPQWQKAEQSLSNIPFLLADETGFHPDFRIGNTVIAHVIIVELVQHFGYQYRVHAPFIQPIESLALIYTSSPLLFWTIILLASQHHPEHSHLYDKLLSPHQELLKPFSHTAIHSIHEIHTLLLLCLWPIPERPESLSPTWNYIGLAVHGCMRLDLHKAVSSDPVAFPSRFSRHKQRPEKASLETKRLTWLACFAITTQEAMFMGFMPPLSSHLHLKHTRKAIDGLKGHLLPGCGPKFAIYETICNYSVVLEDVEDASAQFSLVETFDGSLDTIRQTHEDDWSSEVEMLLQYAKLNLSATAIVRLLSQTEASDSQVITHLQSLMIRGSKASSRLIRQVKSLTSLALASEGQPGQKPMPICYPRYYFEVIFFATMFLFRMCYLRPAFSQPQGNIAVEGLIEVSNLYQLFPQHKDTSHGAMFIQRLICYTSSEEASYPNSPLNSLTATNRLGASIVWDTLQYFQGLQAERQSLRRIEKEHEDQSQLINDVGDLSLVMPDTLQGAQGGTGDVLLQSSLNLGYSDMDLYFPPFGFFGLDAGEQIIW